MPFSGNGVHRPAKKSARTGRRRLIWKAACSGFIYGLEIGQQFIMSRTYDTVLVIGAENFLRLWIGQTATPVCCLVTARGRRFCKAVRIRMGF